MSIRIPWDKYEVALLLDYCIKVENKNVSRTEAISIVSQTLRNRAASKGFPIDDIFRNENGIGMQMSAMRNCYLGKEQGLSISKLFYETVALKKENPDAFYQILEEESSQMNISTWQDFLLWLKETYPKKEKDTLNALRMINAFGRKSHIMKIALGDMHDPAEIEALMKNVKISSSFGFQSKKNVIAAYQALQVYLEFLNNNSNPDFKKTKETNSVEDSISEPVYYVDFNESRSYAHTKPVSCTYRGCPITLSGWNAIFRAIVKAIYEDYKENFPLGQSLSASSRVDTGAADGMINPKEIADGIYLECNVSATAIVNKIRSLMNICGIDYNAIKIQYRYFARKEQAKKTDTKVVAAVKWEPKYTEAVKKILSIKYKYGFRIGSAIEMMKIRNYAEAYNFDLPSSNDELEKEITAAGFSVDGKVYVFSQELIDGLRFIIDEIFNNGANVIFIKPFVERNEEWLEENHISSEAILKEVLKINRPKLWIGQNIITRGGHVSEYEAILSEIHRVAFSDGIVCISNLAADLPYIPADKIAWCLSASDDFVWVSEGKYFCISEFIYNDVESEAILNFVSEECENKGYASVTELPMGSIPEENYQLSVTALYSAIFISILKGKYYMKGKIITADKNGPDIDSLLKIYCQNREECSLTEVMAKAEELTGSTNKQYAMGALFDTLVRTDMYHFVSEKYVNFNVDQIDNVLDEIIGERFAPIREVTTFALFPACGLSWNHYLLESYCYRFSKKYRLAVLNYNDKNAGMIAFAGLSLTYNEMLYEAVAAADVPLTQEAVGEYLFTNGFTAKRKYSNMQEIIENAKTIREER